jgi:HSP20 family molecular chaperone IbpA
MTPKARPFRNNLSHIAITVDELFKAAFHQSLRIYQRESLLGWRPVAMDADLSEHSEPSPSMGQESPLFSNSPDVKIRETSEIIAIEVELPDIDEESLYLEVSGDLLIIRAEKISRDEPQSQPVKTHKPPMVHRYVKLPVVVKPGQIQARLDGPMLQIKIGKPLAGAGGTDPVER